MTTAEAVPVQCVQGGITSNLLAGNARTSPEGGKEAAVETDGALKGSDFPTETSRESGPALPLLAPCFGGLGPPFFALPAYASRPSATL